MAPLHIAQLRVPSSLRRKTLLIIGMTMLGLVGGLFMLSRIVLMRGFAKLEEDFAGRDIERASSALANELNTLDQTTSEYASWDLTYEFARGQRPSYIKTEFPVPTFQELKISFVVIVDEQGRKLFSKGFDLTRGGEMPVPAGLDDHLKPGSLLLNLNDKHGKVAGILDLPGGPALIDSRPILTSDASGPIAGTMIMGHLLDAAEIKHLGDLTLMPVEAQTLSSATLSPDFSTAAAAISKGSPNFIHPLDNQSLAAYQVVEDIYGRPTVIIRVLLPRTIYEQGNTSLVQFLLLLVAAGFVFGAVTLYLLERVVISRIANLTENITGIGASGDLSARLDVPGQDELAFLGVAINGMLEDLEKSQIERHEGRARLALMIERMPAVLWTTDKELRYTSSMGAGLDSLGVKSGGLTGKTLTEYFDTNDPQHPSISAHWRALAGESLTYELHWQKRIFESHVRPLRGTDGEIIGVIGVALDITDRKQLADQLRQSQKLQAVGELAGGVAHDFNNLLMVVKGHAEMLLDRLPAASADRQSPARQNVEQIQQAAERAAALTRQLLAFSRMQVLQPRVLDLNEVVAGMIQMVSRVIGANIELAFLPGANLGRVKADPSQIEQVALNLVVNARDAMPDGGRLTIETSNVHLDRDYATEHAVVDPGHYVMLTVSDTGIGMDAATQSAHLRAIFHHEIARPRHRPGPRDCLRSCEAKRRIRLGIQRSRPWHNFQGVPADGASSSGKESSGKAGERPRTRQRNHTVRRRRTKRARTRQRIPRGSRLSSPRRSRRHAGPRNRRRAQRKNSAPHHRRRDAPLERPRASLAPRRHASRPESPVHLRLHRRQHLPPRRAPGRHGLPAETLQPESTGH